MFNVCKRIECFRQWIGRLDKALAN